MDLLGELRDEPAIRVGDREALKGVQVATRLGTSGTRGEIWPNVAIQV